MMSLPTKSTLYQQFVHKSTASAYFSNSKGFDKLLEYRTYFKLIDNSLDSLFPVTMGVIFVYC